jgi:hypothetical protein
MGLNFETWVSIAAMVAVGVVTLIGYFQVDDNPSTAKVLGWVGVGLAVLGVIGYLVIFGTKIFADWHDLISFLGLVTLGVLSGVAVSQVDNNPGTAKTLFIVAAVVALIGAILMVVVDLGAKKKQPKRDRLRRCLEEEGRLKKEDIETRQMGQRMQMERSQPGQGQPGQQQQGPGAVAGPGGVPISPEGQMQLQQHAVTHRQISIAADEQAALAAQQKERLDRILVESQQQTRQVLTEQRQQTEELKQSLQSFYASRGGDMYECTPTEDDPQQYYPVSGEPVLAARPLMRSAPEGMSRRPMQRSRSGDMPGRPLGRSTRFVEEEE